MSSRKYGMEARFRGAGGGTGGEAGTGEHEHKRGHEGAEQGAGPEAFRR